MYPSPSASHHASNPYFKGQTTSLSAKNDEDRSLTRLPTKPGKSSVASIGSNGIEPGKGLSERSANLPPQRSTSTIVHRTSAKRSLPSFGVASTVSRRSDLSVQSSQAAPTLEDHNIYRAVEDSIILARRYKRTFNQDDRYDSVSLGSNQCQAQISEPEPRPFIRWAKKLHERHLQKRRAVTPRTERWQLESSSESEDAQDDGDTNKTKESRHKKSSSWASSVFATVVKSATVSVHSVPSTRPRSSRLTGALRRSNRTSKDSTALAQHSVDHSRNKSPVTNDAALKRSIVRQQIMYEIMNTEAGYVEDLKALLNVSLTH